MLLILVVSCSKNAQSSCEDYNLLETQPNLKIMPVQNQGSFNTCYAHSLAGSYQANTGRALHPYSIAFEHKQRLLHWKPYDLDFSLASMAWSDIQKKGVCSLGEINQRLNAYRVNPNYNDDQVIYAMKEFFPHRSSKKAIRKLLKDPFEDGEPWKKADLETLFTKLKPSKQEKFFDFLGEEIFADCEKIFPKEELVSQGLGFEGNHKLADAYSERLAQNESVVVGYCSHHMQNENFHSIKPRAIMAVMPSCGAHYTMIVGQRKVGKSCQILIRNSHNDHFWGRDDQSCVCKNENGKSRVCTKGDFSPEKESVSACYYDRERFLSETFDISFIK